MESLRDFDLEALAGGELEDDGRFGDDGVEELVTGAEAGDKDVGFEVVVFLVDEFHGLVVDCCAVWVVHRAVAADDELWGLVVRNAFEEVAAEFGESFDYVRDAFGGVEAGNLGDITAGWVGQLRRRVIAALLVEVVEVEIIVPVPHVLVQSIQPGCISNHASDAETRVFYQSVVAGIYPRASFLTSLGTNVCTG